MSFDLQMRQKEAEHCNNNNNNNSSVTIQRNNDATINTTKMTTTTNTSNKDSISDHQTKQTTATPDSNAQQTNYDSKPDTFTMVSGVGNRRSWRDV